MGRHAAAPSERRRLLLLVFVVMPSSSSALASACEAALLALTFLPYVYVIPYWVSMILQVGMSGGVREGSV